MDHKNSEVDVAERWDTENGFAKIRTFALKNFNVLGLTSTEWTLWLMIDAYRFVGGRNPEVSHEKLCRQMGLAPGARGNGRARSKHLGRLIKSLEDKGWLEVIEHSGQVDEFDLRPGFAKIFALEDTARKVGKEIKDGAISLTLSVESPAPGPLKITGTFVKHHYIGGTIVPPSAYEGLPQAAVASAVRKLIDGGFDVGALKDEDWRLAIRWPDESVRLQNSQAAKLSLVRAG